MDIHTRPLYPRRRRDVPRHVQLILLLIALALPMRMLGGGHQQEFLITAYYSAEPGQCCYVLGGLQADRDYNGEGFFGADGTAVYPGMIAAPPSYAFGTVVDLPSLGAFTVHDRGGAIQELESGVHRLDIWVGHGEEGLARALEFGLQRVKGTVYPPGTNQPRESFALESLPAPHGKLSVFSVHAGDILALEPEEGDRSVSVRILQEHLKNLGYFRHAVTGFYGSTTRRSFHTFLKDYGLQQTAKLTERSAAFLKAAVARIHADDPVAREVDRYSSTQQVVQAQRLLRFLGFYRGRTDGVWSDTLADAVLRFQMQHAIVASGEAQGAGRIGPSTRKALLTAWDKTIVAPRAEHLIALHNAHERSPRIARFLGEGNSGNTVRLLQTVLAEKGFFPSEKINGNFGPLTKESVAKFQMARGIVDNTSDPAAGYVGPATLSQLLREQRNELLTVAREQGWDAL